MDHVDDVVGAARVCPRDRVQRQVVHRQVVPDREGEDVDHLLDVRPDEVGPEDPAGVAVDQQFVADILLTDAPVREAPRQVAGVDDVGYPPSIAAASVSPTEARGGVVKTALGTTE